MTPEKIARINELAKKQKAGTLTDAEKKNKLLCGWNIGRALSATSDNS